MKECRSNAQDEFLFAALQSEESPGERCQLFLLAMPSPRLSIPPVMELFCFTNRQRANDAKVKRRREQVNKVGHGLVESPDFSDITAGIVGVIDE